MTHSVGFAEVETPPVFDTIPNIGGKKVVLVDHTEARCCNTQHTNMLLTYNMLLVANHAEARCCSARRLCTGQANGQELARRSEAARPHYR
jgi:hypothetical protein